MQLMGFNTIRGTIGMAYIQYDNYKWRKYFGKVENECLNLSEKLTSNKVNICFCLFNCEIEFYEDELKIENSY